MTSKKGFVVDAASRAISGRLGLAERPRFADTNLVLGIWKGFTVQIQIDSAYLHGIAAPAYWVRCYLQSGTKYRTVLRYANGRSTVVKGLKGTGTEFSSDFPFSSDAELEATLSQLGAILDQWEPEPIETTG